MVIYELHSALRFLLRLRVLRMNFFRRLFRPDKPPPAARALRSFVNAFRNTFQFMFSRHCQKCPDTCARKLPEFESRIYRTFLRRRNPHLACTRCRIDRNICTMWGCQDVASRVSFIPSSHESLAMTFDRRNTLGETSAQVA